MDAVALAERVTETDPVRHWRLEELRKAGYPPWDALVLSRRADIDLHLAQALLKEGCPLQTAMQILL